MKDEFKYEVKKIYGAITESEGYTTELRLISFNGKAPKYDLRKWKKTDTGEIMLKGVPMTKDELLKLRNLLVEIGDAL